MMTELKEPKTQFVRDRISETKFSDMAFIKILLDIEDNIPRYHDYPRGSGKMYLYFHNWVEQSAIKAEMLEGKITTTQEYIETKRKAELESQKQQTEDEIKAAKEKKEELEQWIKLGGLPD
jgi:hypothetical protein